MSSSKSGNTVPSNADSTSLEEETVSNDEASSLLDVKTLLALMQARNWDQWTLAQTSHVNRSVISRLIRQTQTDLKVSVLTALGRALETPVDTLLTAQARPQLPKNHSELQQEVYNLLSGSTGLFAITELALAVIELASLSQTQQRQVAALLRAYLVSSQDS